ncbi:MAG: Mrp/NBP35 family ATP-binding protein [Planctomycetaceae bacterium]|nr:Mrp/NBP35 family ATP-binding protein [Planctomycetaceae bacterium]
MPKIPPTEAAVRAALADFQDPETGRSIVQLEQVHALQLEGSRVRVTLGLTTWSAPLWDQTRDELLQHLRARLPGADVEVELDVHHRRPEKLGEIGLTAKTVLAVGSGKGGVGKSSIAAYLALGLQRAGCQVGLMDADLYGPSIPHLFGCHEQPQMVGDKILPVMADDLRMLSMGLLVPEGEAVIWRGPMLHNALLQFLRDTAWGDLDYLIIDMPPGTGDVAISLSQLLPLSGAVVVCTPQDVALLDAVKAVSMFRKVNIDVLGMVENMSYFVCPNCDARHDIFGSGGARRRAEQLSVPFLGELPIRTQLRADADAGRVAASLDDPVAGPAVAAMCRNLVANLSARHRTHPKLPTLPILG